ncbi:MAG: hypothetical protein J5934_05025 [Succinivibrio sp.]|nr:hypothetical protein [Succinivibrio sp.]
MKRSPHAFHSRSQVSRNRRRVVFLKNLKNRTRARHLVFFNQEKLG